MLNQRLSHTARQVRQQAGFSLVEMMIAMALSLILFGGLLNAYVATVKSSSDLMVSAHLDNELHKLLDMMARDIRRAGTHGNPQALISASANPFSVEGTGAYTGETANSCITFSYDWDSDGVLDTGTPDERYGYRLKSGLVQTRTAGLACNADGNPNWADVTDANTYTITGLQFVPTTLSAEEINVREVRITLTAQLVTDAAVTRSLSKTVRVRNDLHNP